MRLLIVLCVLSVFSQIRAEYEPNWDSLDTRPAPTWYDEAKIGIFLHWGVFSVPSLTSEWFWYYWSAGYAEPTNYMKNYFPPGFSYQEFARDFTAEFFNAKQWAELFAKSGAKYVVLTSKHHEGFTLWPSKYSFSWNAKDIGPHRDLVGELGEAVRDANLKFGLYHSLFEWFNPLWAADKAADFKTNYFVRNKILPEMYELVNAYKPSIFWSDGDAGVNDTYWQATNFLAWLYNDSPVKDEVLVNDRWGDGIMCNHGDFITCSDRYNPGELQNKKWENAMTLDGASWGFRRNAQLSDYLSFSELLTSLASTVSYGGNLLINVGPTKDGIIRPIFEERLTQLGQWLEINGEAIYSSTPWASVQTDIINTNVWYTRKNDSIYAIDLEWPQNNTLILGSVAELFRGTLTDVSMLGNDGYLAWVLEDDQLRVKFPDKATVKSDTAWVVKITPRP